MSHKEEYCLNKEHCPGPDIESQSKCSNCWQATDEKRKKSKYYRINPYLIGYLGHMVVVIGMTTLGNEPGILGIIVTAVSLGLIWLAIAMAKHNWH